MATPGSPGFQMPAGDDDVMRRLRDLERYVAELGPSIAASIKPTMDQLRSTVADLGTAQAALTTQQATLAAQQASLTAQLASINTLIGQQTTGVAAAPGTGSGFNVSTSQATKASTTITVPSGYTQALVMAVGSLTMADTAANRFDTRCGIAGNYGAALPNLANTVGSTAAAHTRTLTGLSTGGTITLEVQALAAVSATNAANTAIVTGFAIFFR